MAPDAAQRNVRVLSKCSQLVRKFAWEDPVTAKPGIYFNIDAQLWESVKIGTHELAHHRRRRCRDPNARCGGVTQVCGRNAPKYTHRASDSSVTQLLRLIKGCDQHGPSARGEGGTRNRHRSKAVRISLQHHIKVAARRQLRL